MSGGGNGSATLRKYRKKAILEIERSSCGERDEANIERKTAGVTGIRLLESGR